MTPAAKPAGTLYLVATPIGNLEDITFRALRTLKEADLIACEDTRHTQQLLNYYAIQTPTISYHEHNELTRAPELVLQLEEGSHIALVSDAGMPVISDPGYRLVHLAIRHNIPVVPIPGASALVAALSAAGLPVDKFRFLGFLPAKKSQRRKAIEEVRGSNKTLVFYEAPHRLLDMLEDVKEILGDLPVVVAREVTKVHEEFCRGTASEILARFKKKPVKGEMTVLIAPQLAARPALQKKSSIREEVTQVMSAEGLNERAALKSVARKLGLSRSDAYRRMQGEKRGER
ncbi:MAG: 16S rRNA (cytidine(1402)-2'-O)-methyltransferase [Acidobacteria bacterium]|nr:16S rRNA (cytidine(1402)-2'-O)-methyltransferase [Acidobacteriota bacterium]